MSEEIPETADGAVKAYLFAIGFTLVLIGGEMMAEKTQDRFWIGLALVILALPVHLGWVFWKLIKERVGPQLRDSLNRVATDARSWISLLLMVLLALIVSPLFGGLSTNVFIGAIVLWMAVAALITISPTIPIFARQSENIFYSPKVTAHLPTLQTAL